MKNIRLSLLIMAVLFLGFSINACTFKKTFYQRGSGWDYLRFPLLEPYYAIKIPDQGGWGIPLYIESSKRNFLHLGDIKDVTKIAVENGTILVYSSYSKPIDIGGGQLKELHWFILIPDQTELGFETEDEFNISLLQYGIEQPLWQEPIFILQTFDQTRCLDWIPECK